MLPAWLNRNVAGMTLTSFLADVGYEMVTAVLPGFLNTIGVRALALGWIEGLADGAASVIKLAAGWWSDRIGHRKAMVAFGYFLTGTALAVFALAASWPLILLGRLVAWFGKGIRGPLRDAMLAESVPEHARGRAFGLHRAGDTAGAVLGPLIGVALLAFLPAPSAAAPFRAVFVLSLIPGLASVASLVALVRETRRSPQPHLRLWGATRDLPRPYLRFLAGVGVFGLGDFSHTLLVLAAAQLLAGPLGAVRAGQLAALLYALRNLSYAGISFPVGALADRISKPGLLASGYVLGSLTALLTAVLFTFRITAPGALAAVFALAGIYIGIQDALEGAIPAEMTPPAARGTAYGLMGAVNGFGDFAASVLLGALWTAVSPQAGFAAAGLVMLAGALLTARTPGVRSSAVLL
ncbi:MAG: MFS transporter [Acidobacteria bacterium]|nr:MFS transporter [Acidobacteriota bacterium]